jgi:hypothetical protein
MNEIKNLTVSAHSFSFINHKNGDERTVFPFDPSLSLYSVPVVFKVSIFQTR